MPPIYDFDVATNKAPSTLDALEPDEILGRIQNRQEVAEQEYNELIRQSKLPTDRYSPSQAFGASALAILPALAAYAFGGDDKYAYGAMGAAAGGKGAAQYLAEVQSRNKLENEIAGLGAVEASKKLDDLRSLETVATQSGINTGNLERKYDLMLQNQQQMLKERLGARQPVTPEEEAGIRASAKRLNLSENEIQLILAQPTIAARTGALGEGRRVASAENQINSPLPQELIAQQGKVESVAQRMEPLIKKVQDYRKTLPADKLAAFTIGTAESYIPTSEAALLRQEIGTMALQLAVAIQGGNPSEGERRVAEEFMGSWQALSANELDKRMQQLVDVARNVARRNIEITSSQDRYQRSGQQVLSAMSGGGGTASGGEGDLVAQFRAARAKGASTNGK